MRVALSRALMAVIVVTSAWCGQAEDQLSWNGSWSVPSQDSVLSKRATDASANATATAESKKAEEDIQGRNYAVHEPIFSNDTDINDIINEIINSRREGRILNEYAGVYGDGTLDQALQQGDDVEARNLVRDKLCALGLMSCEEAKRPYYSNIYAQSPNKYGGGPYGAPKPMPPPSYFSGRPPMSPPPSSVNSFGPPRKVGYESSYKPGYRPTGPGPNYSGPYLETPPPSAFDGSASFSRPPPGAVIYGSKPPGPVYTGSGPSSAPYTFENPDKIQLSGSQQNSFYSQQSSASASASSNKVVVSGSVPTSNSASSSAAGLQQHVHHHYHHVEGADSAKVPSVSIPVGSGHSIDTDFSALAQSSTAFTPQTKGSFQNNPAFISGFNGASQGGLLTQTAANFGESVNGFKPNGDLYSKPSAGLSAFAGLESAALTDLSQSGFSQSNAASASYHSQNPAYYKKELHNAAGIASSLFNNFNSLNSGYGNAHPGNGYDVSRNQLVDCQCVPVNQCPAADRIGREEELILPLDPRNLEKDIEALSDEPYKTHMTASATSAEISGNATMEDAKRPKRQAIEEQASQGDDTSSLRQGIEGRAYYGNGPVQKTCRYNEVCCRRPSPPIHQNVRCGVRNGGGITGRIKNPIYIDGNSEFAEYPWHVAILKKDPKESVYSCGGTLIDEQHIITAAHCIKSQNTYDLKARLGEWDVNHDVEFYPHIEEDIIGMYIFPQYYAGTLENDLAVLKLEHPVDFSKNPHIRPACLPDKFTDYTGARCWTTGWGKNAFGEAGKYQNILKEVDVPIVPQQQCEAQLRHTRLGPNYKLHPGFLCAGGEPAKDACKGDGGGPLVCENNGVWNVVGVVSWGIGCGNVDVPGVYVRVSNYLDWIHQTIQNHK